MSQAPDLIAIRSARLSAEINPLGAELHALRDAEGRDLMWDGDPAVWAGRAPILFPIVGALAGGAYRWRGQSYALPRHGFARRRLFQLVERDASGATLRLDCDSETLSVYPFRFQLDLRFAVEGATLEVTATVRNLGDAASMPASFGFHPAFRWPLPYGQPRADHRIAFDHPEPAPIRRLDANGLLLTEGLPTPVHGRDLPLTDDLFIDDALIFDRLTSRTLRYGAGEGPQLQIAFPAMPELGVWTKPGAGYLCIEPWRGFADPQGFTGDLAEKPGVFMVTPGGAVDCAMSVTLLAG
ncbi:MAG TPA: aldose 1-epimerase family protein [Caulobacteraceae bacterium]|nr:aldose 1-epimerase family protein [Caulobacteraceae bacterium]